MIKNIIFDIGNVILVKTKFKKIELELIKLLFKKNDALDEINIRSILKPYWNQWKTDKITEKEFFQNIKKKLNLKYPIYFIKKQFYSSHEINLQVVNLIKKLKKQYRIYALSNHAREWYNKQNKQLNFDSLFDGVLTSFQTRIAKPNIEIYKILLKKYNLDPKETIFIDDQEKNLKPARKLKIKNIHYKNFNQLKKELKKNGIL